MVLSQVVGEVLSALSPCTTEPTVLAQVSTLVSMLTDPVPISVDHILHELWSPLMVEEMLMFILGHTSVLYHGHFR